MSGETPEPNGRAPSARPHRTADKILANEAWESLMRAYATMMRTLASDDIWGDVSVREYDVLYTLAKAGREMRQSELVRSVLLSQPAISRLVDRLVARGLVARRCDPTDRRSFLLSLTRDGREAQRRVGHPHGALVAERMLQALDHDQLRELRDLTSTMTKAVDNDYQ